MKEISDKSLFISAALILIASFLVANSDISFYNWITGAASTSEAGNVSIQIRSVVSINASDESINFGQCIGETGGTVHWSNSTQTKNASSLAAGECSYPAGTGTVGRDEITIENDGNSNANVSVKSSLMAGYGSSGLIGGTTPKPANFSFIADRNVGNNGCFNWTGAVYFKTLTNFSAANTDYLLCENLTYSTNNTVNLTIVIYIPGDAPTDATPTNATLTFTASASAGA